jgi:hypothetical protein
MNIALTIANRVTYHMHIDQVLLKALDMALDIYGSFCFEFIILIVVTLLVLILLVIVNVET